MKDAGPQLLHEQREHQHSQRAARVCVWNQDGASLEENRVWTQNNVAKWEKPFCGSGMKKIKFREEDYQMLPLPIDRKSSHRDQLFSIFVEGKMRKTTDFIFSKKDLGLLLAKFPFCMDRWAVEQRWCGWGCRIQAIPNACDLRTY